LKTVERRRGRPRAYDPQEAVRLATRVFWKTGYSGTSLENITAATGMNRPSISAAFGSKHALYLKALRGYWDFKLATLSKALEGGTLREALSRAYDASLSIYFSGEDSGDGCFALGTAITEAGGDEEIRGIVAAGFDALDTSFEARIRKARDAGEISEQADPGTLAVLACATMQTISLRARAGVPRATLQGLAHNVVDVICG
jgi:AcrR family transcriptional regulator